MSLTSHIILHRHITNCIKKISKSDSCIWNWNSNFVAFCDNSFVYYNSMNASMILQQTCDGTNHMAWLVLATCDGTNTID